MDINELRKLVRQRHDAATAKVSRLRRNKGVEIGGSREDIRRDPAKIKRYTRPQLEAYLRQLNSFTSRGNSYVAGADGQVIPGSLWRQYQQAERQYLRRGQQRDEARGGIKLPGQDMTVAQRAAMMRPNQIRAGGEATNKPYAVFKERKPSDIPGVEALQKLIEGYKKKNSRDYLPEYLKGQRKQAEDMLKELNLHEQIKQVRELTDDQFDTLFNDTAFAGDLGMRYASEKMAQRGNRNAAHDAIMQTNEAEVNEQIAWARNLPPRIRRK